MAEIPYFFDTPTPRYFRENGWFANENAWKFITWAFSKCQNVPNKVFHDGKELTLSPFEFITGRDKSSKECFLSEEAFRHQLRTLLKSGFLEKTPNSAPNRFTCYKWVTTRFLKPNPQLNHQLTPNSPPTEPPQDKNKKDISNDISNEEEARRAARPHLKDSLSFNFEKMEFEGIGEKDIAEWKTIYPHIDLQVEILKATNWLKSNPSKSNKKNWRKYLTGWLGRTNDSIENKKAYRTAANGTGQDRRTKDINGNPVDSPHTGRF